jgi:hypothetical protein
MHKEYPISEMYIAGYLGRPMTGRQSLEDVENVMWYKSHINEVLKGMNIFSIRLFRIISISSAKPCDFDGMLGRGLPVSMYTTKTPIDSEVAFKRYST